MYTEATDKDTKIIDSHLKYAYTLGYERALREIADSITVEEIIKHLNSEI